MNALRDAMSHAVLGWVKPELDETLRQARTEVEAFVEYPADTSRMRFCAGYLHQVQGTLRMVELYAPAMVAEEMELLAQALQEGAVADRDEACATLMRGTVLLPDYLERLQNGHRDIPIVLLPLLNEIRAARGAAGLSESVLFAPDLSRPLPEQVSDPAPLPWPQRRDRLAEALDAFEAQLAAWPEGGAPSEPAALAASAAGLLEHAEHETTRRMLWVLASAAAALRDGALAGDEHLHAAFDAAVRALRQTRDPQTGQAMQGVASQEPTRQLLYLVTQSRAPHPDLEALREAFDLEAYAPSQAEIDHARGSLAGRNRSLLDTVGGVVKEELLRVKDALDLHLRTGGDAALLQPQAAELARVADTLGMLGLGVARDVVLAQRDTLDAIAQGQQPASESALLDIAGALLYVDASLDDQVARLGAPAQGTEDTAAAEARRTVEVLAHEAISNFAAAREQFVAFIETNWDHARLHDVPRLLDEVAGALRILELPRSADYLDAVRRYIATELIGRLRVPSGRQLDTLADAMASLEYYLEALRDRRPNRDEILEIAHSSLEALGYWPSAGEDEDEGAAAAPAAAAWPPASAPAPAAAVVGNDERAPAASADSAGQVLDSGFISASEHLDAAPATGGFDWDTVEIETPQRFATDASDEASDEEWSIAPIAFDGPERESLALPPLEVELPALVPPTLEAPAPLDVLHISFDPVDAEQAGATSEATTSWDLAAFDPVAAEHADMDAGAPPAWEEGGLPLLSDAGEQTNEVTGLADAPLLDVASDQADQGEPPLPADPLGAAPLPSVAEPARPPAFEAAASGQWLDLTIRMQAVPRPERGYESKESHLELDGDSSELIVQIAPIPDDANAGSALPAEADMVPDAAAPGAASPPSTALFDEIAAAAARLPLSGTVEPAPAVEAPAAPPAAGDTGASVGISGGFEHSEEIDAEIREVFLEEFDEELANLERLLPVWRALAHDMERLRPIRRVFHTLKGSGRLVGARALGEFSWKIEGMLNRVLDGSRPASPAVLAMVQHACGVLPQFNAALRGQGTVSADLAMLETLAERIGAGEEVMVEDAVAVADAAPVAAASVAPPPALDEEAGTAASVDSVLREILEAEVGTHLETVDAWLAASGREPTPASDALLRAMHTMNGAFAMTDVPEITLATDPAETYIKRLLATGQAPLPEGVAALAETAEAIRDCIDALRQPAPRIARQPSLVARLQALADSLPEVSWPRDLHEDLDLDAEDGAPADLHAADDLSAYLSADVLAATPGGLPKMNASAAVTPADETPAVAAALQIDAASIEAPSIDALPPLDQADAGDDAVAVPADPSAVADAFGVAAADQPWTLSSDEEAGDGPAQDPFTEDGQQPGLGQDDGTTLDALPAAVDDAAQVPDTADIGFDAPDAPPPPSVAAIELHDAAVPEDDGATLDGMSFDPVPAAWDEAAQPLDTLETALDAPAAAVEPLDAAVPEDAANAAVPADTPEPESGRHVPWPEDADVAVEPAADAPDAALGALQGAQDSPAVDEAGLEFEPMQAVEPPADPVEAAAPPAAEIPAWGEDLDATAVRDEVAFDAAPEQAASELDAAADAGAEEAGFPSEALPEQVAQTLPAAATMAVAAAAVPSSADGMLDFGELDRELVDIFVEEGGDLLDHIDHQLHALREDPAAREPVVELQRDLHTLKGGARMAGIVTIGDLGHAIESLLEAVAGNRTELQREDIGLLERGFDTLHELLVQTRAHRATQMPDALIAAFEARVRGEVPAAPGVGGAESVRAPAIPLPADLSVAPVPVAVLKSGSEAATPTPLSSLSTPIEDEAVPVVHEEGVPRAPQEQVRVRADLLDSLVNHAGEVAIYRSRLEQQLGAFRGALAELDRTNARLRDQLRRLDLETEAQIVARYQREHDSAEPAFDPLELDRFSTLQQLSRALNESAADLGGLQGVLDDLSRQYDVLLQQQSRVSSDLQDGLMSARMVPFDSIVPRLRRVVRQAGHDTGKQVQLKLDGTHGELDRNVLDRMVAPLEHMLRNSVAHGLEAADQRRTAGKDEEGTITIGLRHEGSEIVLRVADDGRGLDRAAIRRRAEQRGLIRADAVLTDAELDSVIFESGFSTTEQVSQLAGRGVGMDVVRNEVRQLGGSVEIASTPGKGVVFTLRLPQTLAVTQAVFVRIGETTYAVPVASVSGIGRIARERFEARSGGYHYAGEEYALHDLGVLVGQASAKAEGQEQMPLLLVRAGDLRAAVAIDQVLGNREIVVKPVGLQISSVPGIYGATITGDGRVIVILDVAPLVRRHLAQPAGPVAEAAPVPQRHVPLVMVVDDSLTMRKVTSRVLERHNFEVALARDGVEALEKLEERVPDLMLLDIEMPRMDGYELATAMRADERYRGVPIVMITSRTGDKHRQRAFEIGVQRYLGKPYQELDLMRNVYDLLGIARVRE